MPFYALRPYDGTFGIAATFSGLSALSDSVYVHVLDNGTLIFNSSVFGSPNPTSYSGVKVPGPGSTVDFVVASGNLDGTDYEDTTPFNAVTKSVPEPRTVRLDGAGLGCLLSLRLQKRKYRHSERTRLVALRTGI
jgi:hypothetical protein